MKKEIMLENQEPKKKRKIFKIIIILFFFIIVSFYLYIRFLEPNRLVVYEHKITDNALPYSFHGLKIVHFSDILYGGTINKKNIEKIVNKINELKPDIVLFTGDLFNKTINSNENDKVDLKENLKKIEATYKKYAILGDNDFISKNEYIEIMEHADFMILNNKNDLFYYGGSDPILFVGTNSLLEENFNSHNALTSTEDISNYYKIWLSHEPVVIDELIKNNIHPNLVFAGHHLNGLIKFHDQIMLLKQNGTLPYTKNYYNVEGIPIYISGGLGTFKYSVRFLNPPSINLYRLYQY